MSPKKIAALLSLCLQATFTIAINQYRVGDTLFVWATSGLSLRAEADFDGKKISTIPFGARIIVLEEKSTRGFDGLPTTAFPPFKNYRGEEFAQLSLTGNFVNVNFEGTTGYLFDAYLSKLPTPEIERTEHDGFPFIRTVDMFTWLESTFGILKKEEKQPDPKGMGLSEHFTIYKNGVVLKSSGDSGGADYQYIYPFLSLEEGYLLINVFQSWESHLNYATHKKMEFHHHAYLSFHRKNNSICFQYEGSSSEATFYPTGMVILSISYTEG